LDNTKQSEIVAILSVGCSQRIAARYVGCAPATIRRTAARDATFAGRLRKAACNAEVGLLQQIRNAAKKEQYWRAAAWALERVYPQRYARRGPDVITVEQIAAVLAEFAKILSEEVPVDRYRKRLLKRLSDLSRSLTGKAPAWAKEPGEEGGRDSH
jgi:hypothetical protein